MRQAAPNRSVSPAPETAPVVSVPPRLMAVLRALAWLRRRWLLAVIVAVALLVAGLGATEYVTSRPSFCARCHNMKPYHQTWLTDQHSKEGVLCVDCHYAPGEQHSLHAKLKGLSQVTMYAAGAFGGGRLRGHVSSDSCLASECHPRSEFESEAFPFPREPPGVAAGASESPEASPEGAPAATADPGEPASATAPHSLKPFVHRSHLKFLTTGHDQPCASCHERRPGETHMAVYAQSCFLCHFTKTKFNTGPAACLTCHELPTEPIQESGENPITHQVLVDRGLACASCHSQDVRGDGTVHFERCIACHDKPGVLAEWEYVKPHECATKGETDVCESCQKALTSKQYLHEAHVPTQHANCSDCHLEIEHGKFQDDLVADLKDCSSCHQGAHESTIALLLGRESERADAKIYKPHEMWSSHTTCTGCHVEVKSTAKYSEVMGAGEKACKSCHGETHNVFQSWRAVIGSAQEEAAELQKEARAAFTAASAKLPAGARGKMDAALRKADDRLIYLKKAGAFHNQKTALELFNQAMDTYEDTIEAVETQ